MHRVRIELCGRLADLVSRELTVELPATGLPISGIFDLLAGQHPALAQELNGGRIRACLNEAIVPVQSWVMPADSLALFPPVSGG